MRPRRAETSEPAWVKRKMLSMKKRTSVPEASRNCSASVSQFVKQRFADVQRDYPNVDGVIAITHKSGCALEEGGEDHLALQRVLAGYARHANVAAYVVIGLGCEVNQAQVMVERQGLRLPIVPDGRPPIVTIQESGGIKKAVERAVGEVARLLPLANQATRSRHRSSSRRSARLSVTCTVRSVRASTRS